jgi:hypothetical protein
MKMRAVEFNYTDLEFQKPQLAIFEKGDTHKTILFPWFSDFYSPLAPTLLIRSGIILKTCPHLIRPLLI